MNSYDVTVIGSGPGGYVAAIRCSQLGLKTALIEKYNSLGGTCLNVGCIPSKSLLDSSHHFEEAIKNFNTHGIEISGDIKINLQKMISRKQSVVDQTVKGINYLMDKNKIDVYNGIGTLSKIKAAAAYNALSSSGADIIVNPQYVVEKKVSILFLTTTYNVTVMGKAGNITVQ